MIVVTGASGFVGRGLHIALRQAGKTVRALSRFGGNDLTAIGPITPDTDWIEYLQNVTCVVHLAARVHILRDQASNPLQEFRMVNTGATLDLARQAAEAGVRRFVFVSSIKVNGEVTSPGCPFRADDPPRPADPYAVSKMEAEQGLHEIAATTGMEIVIIRPPLIYGPGVKANFANLMKWISRGVPLPFGAITENRRSLIAVQNLIDLIVCCTEHPRAAGQLFLASDGEDLSTAELVRRIGVALGRPARLDSVPVILLNTAAILTGKADVAQRLLGSLQIDSTKTCDVLGWRPPLSTTEGLLSATKALRES
jgi:nucleoside-diphosphate-sugar epimerase